MSENQDFNPWEYDEKDYSKNYTYGVVCAILDEVSQYHCGDKKGKPICQVVNKSFPTAFKLSPGKFIKMCLGRLQQLRPFNDIETRELMGLACNMIDVSDEKPYNSMEHNGSEILGYAHTRAWFDEQRKLSKENKV